MDANESTLTEEDRYSVFEMLRKLTPEHELLELAPLGPTAVYTTLVTLWMHDAASGWRIIVVCSC